MSTAADTSIVVTNISTQLKEHHLRELFECCGTITKLEFTDSLPRICSITFADPAHAKAAVFLSGTPLGDRELNVVLKGSSLPTAPSGATAILQQLADNTVNATNNSAGQATNNPNPGAVAGLGTLSAPLLAATQKRLDEVARTIYVGNINCVLSEEELKQFFRSCGQIAHVKMAGETIGKPSRFAFIEFTTTDAAAAAFGLTGTMLAGLPIKIGKAINPIFKPGSLSAETKKEKLADIMKKVREATSKIDQKVKEREQRVHTKSPDKNQERKRRSRSRSHSRSRGWRRKEKSRERRRRRRRSRSRSRGRRRGERRSRSRERYRRRGKSKSRSRSPVKTNSISDEPEKKHMPDRTGQFFNGYCWQPIEAIEANPMNVTMGAPVGMGAVRTLLTQQAALYAQQQQQQLYNPHLQQQLQQQLLQQQRQQQQRP